MSHAYLALYKPYGVLSQFTDSAGRSTLATYIHVPDVYAAGRLDRDSEGLLLLTSDGRLAHRITDPRYTLWKTYWVQVERRPSEEAITRLRDGVVIGGRKTRPACVERLEPAPVVVERTPPIRFRKTVPTAWLTIRICEGINRQIRRMTASVGYPTLRLIRVAVGPITLDGLAPGTWRRLSSSEVASVFQAK